MKTSIFEAGTVLFAISVMLVGVGGWVANIIKLCEMDVTPLTTLFVVRVIGVFVAPLGSVLGLFV